MTHLITSTPMPVQQWASEWMQNQNVNRDKFMATRAAQWGWDQREPEIQAAADQELEACCEWLAARSPGAALAATELRAARRPKPPSLKEQALEILRKHVDRGYLTDESSADADTIRRALEQLDD